MKNLAIAFLAGCIIVIGVFFFWQKSPPPLNPDPPEETGKQTKNNWFSTTEFKTYIADGKKDIQGVQVFLAATVTRKEQLVQYVTRRVLRVLPSDATVVIDYTAEYQYGYNLDGDNCNATKTEAGYDVTLRKPFLVGMPGTSKRKSSIPNKGWTIDENKVLVGLHESLDTYVKKRGEEMASTPEVVALCEKELIEFMSNFLKQRQQGKTIPKITLRYI